MPRARTDHERDQVKTAASEFRSALHDEYGDLIETSLFIGDPHGDIGVRINTRDVPYEVDGPINFGPLFRIAYDHHFRPIDGDAYKINDIGTANSSVNVGVNFEYTHPKTPNF